MKEQDKDEGARRRWISKSNMKEQDEYEGARRWWRSKTKTLLSSFPLAFSVIWGRRYGCWSTLSSKPCLLRHPLSVLQSACPSCTHPSTLSLVSLSSFPRYRFRHHSPHYVIFFHPHDVPIPFQSSLRYLSACRSTCLQLVGSCPESIAEGLLQSPFLLTIFPTFIE